MCFTVRAASCDYADVHSIFLSFFFDAHFPSTGFLPVPIKHTWKHVELAHSLNTYMHVQAHTCMHTQAESPGWGEARCVL